MKTEVSIERTRFLINGKPTYEGLTYKGHSIEGLLFNSRMIQAIFDDANQETRDTWKYPDTGRWDSDRNTSEFCMAIPEYKAHGMLAFTVGLQGGGSVYEPGIYNAYDNSAFAIDGSIKEPYMKRLGHILSTADDNGMVVIVNYFYWQHARRFNDEHAIIAATRNATDWLLETGYKNILIDVVNESNPHYAMLGIPIAAPGRVHELIDIVKSCSLDGRRLLVGCSSGGGSFGIPHGKWLAAEDFSMPHGNGCTPELLKFKIMALREEDEYVKRPRPVLINEDGTNVDNLEAAIHEFASWGFYCQGYGSKYADLSCDWRTHPRESSFDALSGFQTVPVNWSINTPDKRAFFDRLELVTSGRVP